MANGTENQVIKVVLKWVAGIAAVLIAGFTLMAARQHFDSKADILKLLNAHEVRITKVETCIGFMSEDIKEIKGLTQKVYDNQVKRERREANR